MPKRKVGVDVANLMRSLRQLPAVKEWLSWRAEEELAAARARIAVRAALNRRGVGWFARGSSLDWLCSEPPDHDATEPAQRPLNLSDQAPAIVRGALGHELLALPRVQSWLEAWARLRASQRAGKATLDETCRELETREKARLAVRLALRRRGCAEPFVRNFDLQWLLETKGDHHE